MKTLVTLMVIIFAVATAWAVDTQTTLYTLQGIHTGKSDGDAPGGGLIADAAGNLYGITYYGGIACTLYTIKGCGAIFELSPNSNGSWTETVLYRFTGGADGAFPSFNLLFDASGSLYGTSFDGANTAQCTEGCGTIFQLSPGSSGWTFTTIYTFAGGADGSHPQCALISDGYGNLYGTTAFGGDMSDGSGTGTVFELLPSSSGWTKTTLFTFPSKGTLSQGIYPSTGLAIDNAGNLYGTTVYGGSFNVNGGCVGAGCGTVFRLTRTSSGWRFGLLYSFQGPKGSSPNSSLVIDATGNLYGTTYYGAAVGTGVTFELSPTTQGQWKETVLHSFADAGNSHIPQGIVMDASGNLFGTSGTIAYRLTPSAKGGWIYQVLATLTNGNSVGPLLLDASHNLYGTSYGGGSQNAGTVFELSPAVTASGNSQRLASGRQL